MSKGDMTMGHTGVTLIPNTGMEIPRDFAELVLKHEDTTLGFATVQGDALLIEPLDASTTVDSLEEIVKSLDGSPLALSFQHMDKDSPESRQPFVGVVDDEGRNKIAIFMNGDFTQFEEPQSAHSGAFFAFVSFLRPRINKLYQLCGGDLDKVFDELDDSITKDDFSRCWGDFGSITFMGANGKILTLEDNDQRITEDWGYASKSFGWTGAKKVEEPPKKLSIAEQIKARVAAKGKPAEPPKAKVEDKKPEPPKEVKKPEPALANGGATALTGQSRVTMVKKTVKVPNHLSQSGRKKWFRQLPALGGVLPDDWKTAKEVVVEEPAQLSDLAVAAKPSSVPAVAAKETPATDNRENKVTAPAAVGKKEPIAVIEPLAINKLKEILKRATFQKAKDYNSQEMLDPKHIAGLESKIGPVWSQVPDDGVETIEDTFHWPLEAYIQIGEADIRTLALIAYQSRIDYQKLFALAPAEAELPEKKPAAASTKQKIAM